MLEKPLKNDLKGSKKRKSKADPSQKKLPKHIRFDEGEDNLSTVRPACTVEVFSNSKCYVADIACDSSVRFVAAGLSNNRLNLYDVQAAELRLQSSQREHEGPVTGVLFPPQSPQQIFSSGADGAVLGWDMRTGKRTQSYEVEGAEIFSFDICSDQNLLAAGIEGTILFWDLRKSTGSGEDAVQKFEDTHQGDVTKVAFHPSRSKAFLSASEDGLISAFDFSNSFDEDDSFQAAVNLMDSINSFGFYGKERELLWCRTSTESFYLWEWAAACSEDAKGGASPMGSVRNAREKISLAASKPLDNRIEYLLDCTYDESADQLFISAGTGGGDMVVCPIRSAKGSCEFYPPTIELSGGHNAVRVSQNPLVRCQAWPSVGSIKSITGGEDGRIVAWSCC